MSDTLKSPPTVKKTIPAPRQLNPNFLIRLNNRLRNLYGVARASSRNNSGINMGPADRPAKGKRDQNPVPLNMSSEFQRFWEWWLHECHDNNDSLRQRAERIQDLDYMRYNDGVINMAIEMHADETVQADSQSEVLGVSSSNPEVERYIRHKLVQWGYDQHQLRTFAEDIAQYGETFTINSTVPGEGIVDIVHVDPRIVKDRIEFRASDVNIEFISANGFAINDVTRIGRLQALQGVLSEVGSTWSKYFRTFLFGFQLENDLFLPPWNVSHFRNFTTKKEIYPWGKSSFIYSISLFRQLKAAKNLMAVTRAMSLPREIFKVKMDAEMTWSEKWEALNEAKEEYQNISDLSKTKEEMTSGSQIWTIMDEFEFEWKSAEVNVGEIKDVEMLRDDEIISTRIPKGYLIIDKGNFGASGQSLLQQYKPFGRSIFNIQSILMREISNQLRLDMMIGNKFEGELTEFELSMNFPMIEEARDRTQAKIDAFNFAKTVIDSVKELVGIEGTLPPDVIRSILTKLTFLSSEDIEAWIEGPLAQKAKEAPAPDEGEPEESVDPKKLAEHNHSVRAKMTERFKEETIKIAEFTARKMRFPLGECLFQNRHRVMSYSESGAIDPQQRAVCDLYKKGEDFKDFGDKLVEFVASEETSLVELLSENAKRYDSIQVVTRRVSDRDV